MIKEINGLKYEFAGSNEMYYLSDYDFHIFFPSKTLYLNFESEREQESTRISFLLSDEDFNSFDVNKVLKAFETILKKNNIRIAYNIHCVKEELEEIEKDIKEYLKLQNESVNLDTLGKFEVKRFSLSMSGNCEKDSFVVINYPGDIEVHFYPYINEFKYSYHLLKDTECKFQNKELHIKAIKSKLNLYLSYIGEK